MNPGPARWPWGYTDAAAGVAVVAAAAVVVAADSGLVVTPQLGKLSPYWIVKIFGHVPKVQHGEAYEGSLRRICLHYFCYTLY